MEMGYDIVFKIAIVALAMMVIAVLVRAIKGPRIADRIMAINMIGTMTTSMILIVGLLLDDMAESRRKKKKEEALEPAFDMRNDMILRHVCRVIIPIVFMFGIYIIFNGQISPGGGFAGGSIIGAGMILYSLSFGADKVEQLLNKKRFRIICVIALAFYSLSKCYVFFCGYNGFETHIPLGIPGELLSAGLILPLNIAVGATVACTMYGIYSLFVRGRI